MSRHTPEMIKYALRRAQVGFVECEIPHHMRDAIERYLEHGILPGGFLTALLENNFLEACTKADLINLRALYNWALFLYNYFPRIAKGSPEAVQAWVNGFRESAKEAEGRDE